MELKDYIGKEVELTLVKLGEEIRTDGIIVEGTLYGKKHIFVKHNVKTPGWNGYQPMDFRVRNDERYWCLTMDFGVWYKNIKLLSKVSPIKRIMKHAYGIKDYNDKMT